MSGPQAKRKDAAIRLRAGVAVVVSAALVAGFYGAWLTVRRL